MQDSLGYFCGEWIPCHQMALAIDDIGFIQGVTAVERLRTWGGQLRLTSLHLQRFANSTSALGIGPLPDNSELVALLTELLTRTPLTGDVGMTLFATPGRRSTKRPTLGIHLTELDHDRLHRLCTLGQPLVVSSVQQPSPASWPRNIKVRSRVHYHLADRDAQQYAPDALGVLLDEDGSITETSTSNILLVNGKELVLPPPDRVLPGVMADVVCRLAIQNGWLITRRPIYPDDLRNAAGIWLTGSEPGLWGVNAVDGIRKQLSDPLRKMQKLLTNHLRTLK